MPFFSNVETQVDSDSDSAQWTGSATNPQEEFKMRKMTLQFGARNAKFSNNDQL